MTLTLNQFHFASPRLPPLFLIRNFFSAPPTPHLLDLLRSRQLQATMGVNKQRISLFAVVGTALFASTSAQTFRRSAACPGLGCIYPPSQVDFIAGQAFDIRIEVQAPVGNVSQFSHHLQRELTSPLEFKAQRNETLQRWCSFT